jgi:hypothetical protein
MKFHIAQIRTYNIVSSLRTRHDEVSEWEKRTMRRARWVQIIYEYLDKFFIRSWSTGCKTSLCRREGMRKEIFRNIFHMCAHSSLRCCLLNFGKRRVKANSIFESRPWIIESMCNIQIKQAVVYRFIIKCLLFTSNVWGVDENFYREKCFYVT